MIRKRISRTRRYFRYGLFVLMFFSFLFFAGNVYLRINDQARWDLTKDPDIRQAIFQFDVYQHYARGWVQDEKGRFEIARSLHKKNFFSPVYGIAGVHMMENLANNGYPPAMTTHANYLTVYAPSEENMIKARHYYQKAIRQGYQPAVEKLASLKQVP